MVQRTVTEKADRNAALPQPIRAEEAAEWPADEDDGKNLGCELGI